MTGAVIPAGQNISVVGRLPFEWAVSSIVPTLVVQHLPGEPDIVCNVATAVIANHAPLTSIVGRRAIANAHMISAAPAMLIALRELVRITGPFVAAGVSSPRMVAAYNSATAAIEQATAK